MRDKKFSRGSWMRVIAAVLFLLLLPAKALADVIPVPLSWRMHDQDGPLLNTEYYHVVDRYCDGRKVGDLCEVPGSPLEWAGKGTCERTYWKVSPPDSLRRDYRVVLFCDTRWVRSEEVIPPSAYRLADELCAQSGSLDVLLRKWRHRRWQVTCAGMPRVESPGCRGKSPGDSCMAGVRHLKSELRESVSGVCSMEMEARSGGELKREVLRCEVTPVDREAADRFSRRIRQDVRELDAEEMERMHRALQ